MQLKYFTIKLCFIVKNSQFQTTSKEFNSMLLSYKLNNKFYKIIEISKSFKLLILITFFACVINLTCFSLMEKILIGERAVYRYGFIDKKGNVVIPAKFESIGDFKKGLAPAKLNKKWVFINKKGECVITAKFYSTVILRNSY